MIRTFRGRARLSPSVVVAVIAVFVVGAIAYADVGGSTAAVYKSVVATAPKAPNVDVSAKASATATCDPGQQVIGGGVKVDDISAVSVIDGYPDVDNTAWTAHVGNDDPKLPHGFTVYAVCAASSGTTGATGTTGASGTTGPITP